MVLPTGSYLSCMLLFNCVQSSAMPVFFLPQCFHVLSHSLVQLKLKFVLYLPALGQGSVLFLAHYFRLSGPAMSSRTNFIAGLINGLCTTSQ
jgi:hypothetical protein